MKKLFLMSVVLLLLAACANQENQELGSNEHTPAGSSNEAAQNETDQPTKDHSEEENKAANPENKDDDLTDADTRDKDFFEITEEEWQTLQLSQNDFDAFLTELLEDEEGLFNEVSFDGQTIEFVLKSADGETMENQITAHFMDALVRAFYMRSDYYQNEKQPLIIFLDAKGVLILENDQPLEDGEEG